MDDPVALKALFRRGKAREGLGDADGALADFKAVAELQPANGEAADEVERYASVLHRIVVMSHGDADMRRRQTGGLFAAPA